MLRGEDVSCTSSQQEICRGGRRRHLGRRFAPDSTTGGQTNYPHGGAGLTSLERLRAALEHREPDRVPFDLGSSLVTGMHRTAYANLRRYLGLPERPPELIDAKQQLALIHEDVLDRLAVDVRPLVPGKPAGAAPWREGDYDYMGDEFGVLWKMPVQGGFYFDMAAHPLADADPDDRAVLRNLRFPDPLDPIRYAGLAERADRIMNGEKKAYVLGRNAAGLLEVALCMRGFENFFVDLALNPSFAEGLLDAILEFKLAYWRKVMAVVGRNVLVVSEADDLATQQGLLIGPEMYRRFIKPRHQRLFSAIKEAAQAEVYLFLHSCGAVKELIPDLIETGVDILNPVQVGAKGMDTAELKRSFGRGLTFWGGGVDTQHVLPHGTPQQVRAEVRRRIEDLAPGGGFVFNTVHNTQADVPPENYMAMWEAWRDYGTY